MHNPTPPSEQPAAAVPFYKRSVAELSGSEDYLSGLVATAEGLLDPADPNVQTSTEGDTQVTKAFLVSEDYVKGVGSDGEFVTTLKPYALTRRTTADGNSSYALALPDSTVHRPHNVASRTFEESPVVAWNAASAETTIDTPGVLLTHTSNMKDSTTWDPHTTRIIEGVGGDRLVKRNLVTAAGAALSRARIKLATGKERQQNY